VIRSPKKIVVKYTVFLVSIAIIPLLLIGFLSYQASSRSLLDAEERFISNLLQGQHERLVLQLEQVENLIANISGVEAITQALNDRDLVTDTYTSLATQARIGYILNGYLNLQGLVSIEIFTEGGAHYLVGETLDAGEVRYEVLDQIKQGALQSNRQVYWAGTVTNIHKGSSHQSVLTAARVLRSIDRVSMKQRPIALLLVNYSQEYLADQLDKAELLPGSELELIDQFGKVIYSRKPERTGRQVAGIFAHLMALEEPVRELTWDNERYLIKREVLSEYGWQMVNVIPEQALLSKVASIRYITILLMIMGFALVAMAAWIFTRNILTPIREVIHGYKQLQSDQFDLDRRLSVRTSDEVGELTRWFNSFLDNLVSRQRSEEALRESERRYELVVNASREVLWDWNLQNDTLYLSPRYLSMIGADSHDVIADKPEAWFDRIHIDDLAMVRREINRHLDGEVPHFECEYRLLKNDGSTVWVLSHGLAERDEAQRPIRIAGSHTDISARKEAENQLRHDAFHDVLTGLYNRAWFVSFLATKLSRYSRHRDEMFAVLFLDLDHFKQINDTQGHAAGDELLIQVSERLKECLRASDQLARLGGDEFVILLENSEEQHYINVADRILAALSRPFTISGQEVHSGGSIGITRSSSGYVDPDEMLRDADIAMYQAKLSGKNCFVLFDENMREHLIQRISMEQELKEGLEKNQLELYYQPIVSLQTGRLIGCEALIRWHHPQQGMISPDVFIPLAESSNLIYAIGQWVLENACAQWQQWKEECSDLKHLCLSINLSSMQFNDKEFLSNLPATLAKYNIQGAELAFEITETAIVRDIKLAGKVINEFKRMGINVHLDDFGTGYSSLSHLSDFPIDLIKIDRTFVLQCLEQKKHERVVRGILNMAQELGLKCTAEGIETCEQLQLLKDNKCEYGQGYLISIPVPANRMLEVIRSDLEVVTV